LLHQVGDLFELNIKLWCQKVKLQKNYFCHGCCFLEAQSGIPKNGLGGCGEAVLGSASQ
jgi:hypothetical protein